MRQGFAKIALVLSVAILGGCDTELDNVDISDVEGLWISEHKFGTERLALKADGTYELTFVRADGAIFTNNNTWEIDDFGRLEPFVSFDNFAFGKSRHPAFSKIIPAGCEIEDAPCDGNSVWPVHVTRTLSGELLLVVNSDTGYEYVKQ